MKLATSDGRFDVVVLGPMKSKGKDKSDLANCLKIKGVIERLLVEPEIQALMRSSGFRSAPKVTCPENWRGQNIRTNVFMSIDGADFFVFDMSARPGEPTSSPNVIYELGLVHALGLPYVLVSNENSELLFYLRGFRTILLPAENYPDEERLIDHLREDLLALLEPTNKNDYAANPISDHYHKAAVVDISATTGLATGYYHNFLYRMLAAPNYLNHYAERFDRIVTLVPNSLQSDFETDLGEFKQWVSAAYEGHENMLAKNVTLDCPPGLSDIRNNISIRHIGRVCFDIPSTAYALCHSQRYMSLAENSDAEEELARMEKRLLDQFSVAVERLLRAGSRLQKLKGVKRHLLARIPVSVEEVHALFGPPPAKN